MRLTGRTSLLKPKAEGHRQAGGGRTVEVSEGLGTRDLEPLTHIALQPLDQSRNGGPGPARHDALYRHRALLRRVVLERQPQLVDEATRSLRKRFPGSRDDGWV